MSIPYHLNLKYKVYTVLTDIIKTRLSQLIQRYVINWWVNCFTDYVGSVPVVLSHTCWDSVATDWRQEQRSQAPVVPCLTPGTTITGSSCALPAPSDAASVRQYLWLESAKPFPALHSRHNIPQDFSLASLVHDEVRCLYTHQLHSKRHI